jgi:hypothetical protein
VDSDGEADQGRRSSGELTNPNATKKRRGDDDVEEPPLSEVEEGVATAVVPVGIPGIAVVAMMFNSRGQW